MAFKISGFGASQKEKKSIAPTYETYQQTLVPRKSLVQIRFPCKGMALTYYNDQFDLKPGDRVYRYQFPRWTASYIFPSWLYIVR